MTEEQAAYETTLDPQTGELKPTVTLDNIETLSQDLTKARINVSEAEFEVQFAQEDLEDIKGIVVGGAYADGTIDGSNKQTRDAQEQKLIAENEQIANARLTVRDAERKLAKARATLAGIEARISLTRAWLYSGTSIPR